MSENEMPGMPEMPVDPAPVEMPVEVEAPVEAETPEVPSEDLDVPVLEDEKPQIIEPGKTDNEVSLPPIPKTGILVVAQQKGFFNQQRLNKGAKFTIRSEKQFASWFTCIDPLYEEKRKEFMKLKKAKK